MAVLYEQESEIRKLFVPFLPLPPPDIAEIVCNIVEKSVCV